MSEAPPPRCDNRALILRRLALRPVIYLAAQDRIETALAMAREGLVDCVHEANGGKGMLAVRRARPVLRAVPPGEGAA